jgi:signal transduction histidine kinase
MSQLAIVSANPSPIRPSGARAPEGSSAQAFPALDSMAHDLRNLLATVGLHLETLQRLSGPSGAKAADAAHALLTRGATLCNAVLDRTANADSRARRKGVDPTQVARQVADLLAPIAPEDFSFDIEQRAAASILADPDDLFRILFNLMSNAVAVASRGPGALTTVRVRAASGESLVSMQVADDGPGLPDGAREGLFARRLPPTAPPRHGYGLVIARELAERNGGTLTLAPSGGGTTFVLKLPAFLSVLAQEEPRHLGRRAMTL